MSKRQKNINGFSVVEALLVIIILIVIGVVGYLVAKHENNKSTGKSTAGQTAKSSSTTLTLKTYCDSSAKLCFQYLSTWKITTSTATDGTGTTSVVMNPTASMNVAYGDYATNQGYPPSLDTSNPFATAAPNPDTVMSITSPFNFYTVSVNPPTNNDANYKIVGGYAMGTTDNIPFYFVTNTSTVSTEGLIVGKVTQLQNSGFSLTDSVRPNDIVILSIGPISADTYTPAQATAWLGSTDGKAALQLMQSFYSQ